ncbi:MAG: right-handed parallel beta-helix repeat-containing protein, partial [Myxococcales bacterium]|nr:right-handed parallel beta-helix repeat-containing protein [Myxococcales bacterium]
GLDVWGGSWANATQLTIAGAGGNGVNASLGSAVWLQDVVVTGATGEGVAIYGGSYGDLSGSDVSHGVRSHVSGAGQNGLAVGQGSFANAYGLDVQGNANGGVNVWAVSGVEMDEATVANADGSTGTAIAVGPESYVSARAAAIDSKLGQGVTCGGGFCSVPFAAVTGAGDFGLNAFWNGWIDGTGTVVTGAFTYLTNLPRTSNPTSEGTVYDTTTPP